MFLALLGPVGSGAVGPASATAATADTAAADAGPAAATPIRVTLAVERDANRPDALRVTANVSVPEDVTSFEFQRLPPGATFVSADGFTRRDGAYEWTGGGPSTLTFRVAEGGNRTVRVASTYAYASKFALYPDPAYRYRGTDPGFAVRFRPVGNGTTTEDEVLLWESARTATAADGTHLTVVRPPGPSADDGVNVSDGELEAALETLRAVDEFFGFDRGDDHVVLFVQREVSGTVVDVDAQAHGDRIVVEPAHVTDAELLAHEFVHTQQDFTTTARTDWLVEGSADYLAAYYSLHAGGRSFEEFRDHLHRGREYADVDLRTLTNGSERADYVKGRLVVGALEARFRNASGASVEALLVRLREADGGDLRVADGPALDEEDLDGAVASVAGRSLDGWLDDAAGAGDPPSIPARPDLYGDPTTDDTDGDGLTDAREAELGTSVFRPDTDGDGVGDAREVETGSDPTVADSSGGDPALDGTDAGTGATVTTTSTDSATATPTAETTPTATVGGAGTTETAADGPGFGLVLALLAAAAAVVGAGVRRA